MNKCKCISSGSGAIVIPIGVTEVLVVRVFPGCRDCLVPAQLEIRRDMVGSLSLPRAIESRAVKLEVGDEVAIPLMQEETLNAIAKNEAKDLRNIARTSLDITGDYIARLFRRILTQAMNQEQLRVVQQKQDEYMAAKLAEIAQK